MISQSICYNNQVLRVVVPTLSTLIKSAVRRLKMTKLILTEKLCCNCGKTKYLKEFNKNKSKVDGLCTECRACNKLISEKYKKTEFGLITQIYSLQKLTSKRRGYEPPNYTKDELIDWLYKNGFYAMWCQWNWSGFLKEKLPSVDRLDDYKTYSIENIQLISWKQNRDKSYSDIRDGVNNKKSKEVAQIDKKTGKVIQTFCSARSAERKSGIANTNIGLCCSGVRQTAGGFKWEYL